MKKTISREQANYLVCQLQETSVVLYKTLSNGPGSDHAVEVNILHIKMQVAGLKILLDEITHLTTAD